MANWQKIILAIILGILTGTFLGDMTPKLAYLGIIFLNLIKMVTVPLIFFTIIYGITNVEQNSGNLLRISLKSILAFVITAIIAVIIGITVANLLKPGEGVSPTVIENHSNLDIKSTAIHETLADIVPTNIIAAMAGGNILQIIAFSFFTGILLNKNRNKYPNIIQLFHQIANLLFKMIEAIMLLAPIGVFGYIASIIGSEGLSIASTLGKLMICITVGCIAQYIVFGIMIATYGKISPIPFYKKMIGAQVIAFSTSSSKATLVPLMKMAETDLGISKQSSRFILPLSAALNMDGGAIYQATCAIFFSQILGVELTLLNYATLLITCTIASIGGAGIPGGVLLFLGMVLQSIGLPMEGVLLVAAIDRIMDMITTTVNITGDACVTLLVDRSEKTLDISKYYAKNNDNNSED